MTSIHDLLPPAPPPAVIFPSERTTCHNFTSATPQLVHHSAILSVLPANPAQAPCSTCGAAIATAKAVAFCGLCHKPICSCVQKKPATLRTPNSTLRTRREQACP